MKTNSTPLNLILCHTCEVNKKHGTRSATSTNCTSYNLTATNNYKQNNLQTNQFNAIRDGWMMYMIVYKYRWILHEKMLELIVLYTFSINYSNVKVAHSSSILRD